MMHVKKEFAPVTITFNNEQEYKRFVNFIKEAGYRADRLCGFSRDSETVAYAQYLLKELR